jgi:general secretion pathway protein A
MMQDHYGLTGRPFQLTPDPRFWFESATHKKAMAYLGYGLQQGEGFVVVTGEIGAGKTTLASHLLATVDPARVHAIRIASTQVGGMDALRLVAQGFGLPSEGREKAQLLAAIEAHVTERARAGQRTLLIVDESQNLPQESLEELRMLSNIQGTDRALVQTLLLGQPEFRERLNTAPELEQLRQRVIAAHHLTAMEPEEVGPYVMHRLQLVGWNGTPSFSPPAFAALYRATGGLPRKINNVMTRALMLGNLERAPAITPDMIEAVVADMAQDLSMASVSESAQDTAPTPGLRLVDAAASLDGQTLDNAARIAALEAQVDEQGAALRRVLGLLVEWVEAEDAQHAADIRRAPAA